MDLFLKAFAKRGNIAGACEAFNKAKGYGPCLSRDTVLRWRDKNYLGFADRFKEAQQEFADYVEDRAMDYIEGLKPGQNPLLMIAMLNALRPEKYRPKVVVQDDTKILGLVQQLRELGAKTRRAALPAAEKSEGRSGDILQAFLVSKTRKWSTAEPVSATEVTEISDETADIEVADETLPREVPLPSPTKALLARMKEVTENASYQKGS